MIVSSIRKLPSRGIGFSDLMAARPLFAKLAQNLPDGQPPIAIIEQGAPGKHAHGQGDH